MRFTTCVVAAFVAIGTSIGNAEEFCRAAAEVKGSCFPVRGHVRITNGPGVVLYPADTPDLSYRVLDMTPPVFDTVDLYRVIIGNYVICPLGDEPNPATFEIVWHNVCIESGENMVVVDGGSPGETEFCAANQGRDTAGLCESQAGDAKGR
ncbi:MAG: hypothetical protein AB7E79_08460 [Rhodospirillaceae bacterium]